MEDDEVEVIITLLSLTAFDLITSLVIQTSLSYYSSVEEWHLLSISLGLLTTAWFWGCFFILFGCTVGMFIVVDIVFVDEEALFEKHQNLLLAWVLKDSVACNVITGVYFASRTSAYRALCRGLGDFLGILWTGLCWLGSPLVFVGSCLWTGVRWAMFSFFYGVGHVLWSSCTAIYWVGDLLVRGIAAIISFSWTALWMSRYALIIALLILICYAILEHASIVEESSLHTHAAIREHASIVEGSSLHTLAAIREHASIVEESSNRILSAVDWNNTTVSRALDSHGEQIHRASLTLSNSFHSSSTAITSGMDRHSYTIDRSSDPLPESRNSGCGYEYGYW